jgi:NAD(P)H-dependent FMN reductase
MKIVAIGTSSSKKSINKTFAAYTASLISSDIEVIDMHFFEMPLYSIDKEEETGIPQQAKDFYAKIGSADLLVISLTEHNGTYTAVFKNLMDWCSRIQGAFFQEKPTLLVSTATGKMGGRFVMEAALTRFPIHSAKVIGHFSLPFFQHNFDGEKISNSELLHELENVIVGVKQKLEQVEQ